MKKNIGLFAILLTLAGVSLAGDGKIFSVGDATNYFKVNSDGTAESSGGIAATSLSSAVQTSLGKADTALQPAGNLTGSMGTSTTAVDTVVSGAASGATAVQPADISTVAASVIGSAVDATGLTNNVTIAIQNSADDVSQGVLQWWVSETAGGAASSNNIESATLTTGTSIVAVNLAGINYGLSDTNGSVVVQIVMTAAGTNYINMACGGTYTSEAVVCAE